MTELRKQLLSGAIGMLCGIVPMLWVRSTEMEKIAAEKIEANKERLIRLEVVTDQAANGLKTLIAAHMQLVEQVRETGLQVARLAALIEKAH